MKTLVILIGLFVFCTFKGNAQENIDSLVNYTNEQIKSGNLEIAKEVGLKTLKLDPNRNDVKLSIANIYSWTEKNDSALQLISELNAVKYYNADFFEAYLNILLRNKKYENLLNACDLAENNNYSDTLNLLKKRLTAYHALKKDSEGLDIAASPEYRSYLDDEQLSGLHYEMELSERLNQVIAAYNIDFFPTASPSLSPHHLASLGYYIKENKITYGLQANYAHRFGLNDLQLETNIYYLLGQKSYLYLNYGYGFNNLLFPQHKAGVEYYFPIIKNLEGSFGGRYMYYPLAVNKNVIVATGHLGYYFGRSWASLRPYYITQFDSISSLSVVGRYRLFKRNSERDFWGVEVAIGNSPDDIFSTSQGTGFNELFAYRVTLEKGVTLNKFTDLLVYVGYMNEEIRRGTTIIPRDRYSIGFTLKHRL